MNVFQGPKKTKQRGRILLVNPWIHDFAAYDFWMKPLGLLYLAAILRENAYNLSFIDCLRSQEIGLDVPSQRGQRKADGSGKLPRTVIDKPQPLAFVPRNYARYGVTKEDMPARLRCLLPPDLILVTSSMTYWYPGVIETIRLLKSMFPAVPLVLGGTYGSLCLDHAQAASGADLVLPGPGELALADLVGNFLGHNLDCLPDIKALDSYPYPALDLYGHLDFAPIRTSRGCPYSCSYCASATLSGAFVQRDPQAVLNEILHWQQNFGVRHFAIYDDAFLINQEQMATPLLKEIRRTGSSCTFHAPNGMHLREMNSKIATLLYQANFRTIRFGFESFDLQRQQSTGGKVTNEELIAAVSYLKEAGYRSESIGVYLLAGLPGQEAEEVRKSMEFVIAAGARPIIAEYSPVPGTSLWEKACLLSPFDLAKEPLYHNNTILPCQSADFTYKMLQKLKTFARHTVSRLPGDK
jgi:radical SAM superfamily enzyme YgiQ (UPF0313 family)